MKTLSKFKNFLSDNKLYAKNQNFWKHTLASISEDAHEDWVITKFANGDDFFDGNPIFSALYPDKHKAIRIIQIVDDQNAPSLRAWTEDVQYEDKGVKELVIVIQPFDNAYTSATSLIKLFLKESSIGKQLNQYNTIYRNAINPKRASKSTDALQPLAE